MFWIKNTSARLCARSSNQKITSPDPPHIPVFQLTFFRCSAGVYLTSGATTWTANSDERLKRNVAPLASSTLDRLLGLNPVTFNWKDDYQNRHQGVQLGFIAQEVQQIFPEFTAIGPTTTITLADGSTEIVGAPLGLSMTDFIPPLVKAAQELNLKLEDLATTTEADWQQGSFIGRFFAALKNKLVAWFADATNGIGDLFARVLLSDKLQTNELCVKDVCVTRDQLAAVLTATGVQNSAPEPAPAVTSAEPPLNEAATSTNSTSSLQAAATSSPPTSEPSASPVPSDAATTSPAVIEPTQPAPEQIVDDSPIARPGTRSTIQSPHPP